MTELSETKEQSPQRVAFGHLCFVYSSTLVAFLFAIVAAVSATFIFGGHISAWHFYAGVLLALIYCFYAVRHFFPKRTGLIFLAEITLIAATVGASMLVGGKFYDLSYDGQTYHQEAIIQIEQGWNPFYRYLPGSTLGSLERWVNDYPKAAWVEAAAIYKTFGKIEYGKSLQLILMAAAFGMVLSLLYQVPIIRNHLVIWLVALLVAANPVAIYQSLSFYLDGQLLALLIIFSITLTLYFHEKDGPVYITLISSGVLLSNMKFTGLVYACLAMGVAFVFLWAYEKIIRAFNFLWLGAITLVVAVFVIGFNPYITNTIRQHNPFYPLLGPKSIDLKPYNTPGNFAQKPSYEILFLSAFSKSDNIRGQGFDAKLKAPFTYTKQELAAFTETNAKEGGFGPVFGGAILLDLVILAYAVVWLVRAHRRKKNNGMNPTQLAAITLLFVILAVIISCVINPISSLARYVPQFWLFALLPVLIAFALPSKIIKTVAVLVVGFLAFNNFLVAKTYVSYNINTSRQMQTELTSIAAYGQTHPIRLNFGEMKSTRVRMHDYGIDYQEVSLDFCTHIRRFIITNTTQFCTTN